MADERGLDALRWQEDRDRDERLLIRMAEEERRLIEQLERQRDYERANEVAIQMRLEQEKLDKERNEDVLFDKRDYK